MSDTPNLDLQFTVMQELVPDFVYDELKEYIKHSNTYHSQPLFLREALAKEHKVPSDWIYLANGVDEVIRLAIEALGKNAHIFTPTEYTTFEQFCPTVQTHYSLVGNDYRIECKKIEGAQLIWLANPNNPVGLTDPADIIELAKNNPQATVVVDEIYGEYAPHISVIPSIASVPNLMVCKGFSKTYGLAGIRLGYVIGAPALLRSLSAYAPWANVAYPSCGMAEIALRHKEYYQQVRDQIVYRKQLLTDWLTHSGLVVVPSYINTVVVRLKTKVLADKVAADLAKQNILINTGSNPEDKVGLDGSYISFVVGTDEQIERLKLALSAALKRLEQV